MAKLTQDTMIGHVTDVQSGSISIRLSETDKDSAMIKTIGDEDILIGQVGSYIMVVQENVKILTTIIRITEHEKFLPKDTAGNTNAINESISSRNLVVVPVGSINPDNKFDRGVNIYPTIGAEAHIVGSNIVSSIFSEFKIKNFSVGKLPFNKQQRVYFDPTELFGKHFTILGQTGSGKSHTVATLLQKSVALMPHAHIVLLDLHGEYSWINEENCTREYAFADNIVRHLDARKLEIPYWLLTFVELCDLLVDNSESEASNQIAFFRDLVFELKTEENKTLNLQKLSVDTPIYFPLDLLVDKIETKNNEMVPGSGPKPIKGELNGRFSRLLIRINSKLNDVRYDFLLKPTVRNTSDTLEPLLRDFVGLNNENKANITIIDLSSVPFDVRPTVAAQIGRIAFEFNYWNPKHKDFPIFLLCEEAHNYIPKDSSSEFAGARKSMERIAKEGRKYGVGLGVVSQRPGELSETVLAQCGTFLCLRVTNPADQNFIKALVPDAEKNLTDVLSALGRGECLALGGAVPLPTRVQFDRPDPEPNSSDVDFYSKWKNGSDDIDVAEIVSRWRNQEK